MQSYDERFFGVRQTNHAISPDMPPIAAQNNTSSAELSASTARSRTPVLNTTPAAIAEKMLRTRNRRRIQYAGSPSIKTIASDSQANIRVAISNDTASSPNRLALKSWKPTKQSVGTNDADMSAPSNRPFGVMRFSSRSLGAISD